MRSLLFIQFCFHSKFSWSFVCCCFNGGTKQRKKHRSPNCSIPQEQQQVSVGKKLPAPVKACITTPHTHAHTDTYKHIKRRLKCCSEMETGRHNTGTGFGSQNKNRENWIYTTNYHCIVNVLNAYTHTRVDIKVFSSSGIFQPFSSFNPLIFGCATCCSRRGRGKSFTSSPTLAALTRVLYSYVWVEVIANFGSPTPNPN